MHFRLRYICAVCLVISVAPAYYLFHVILTPNVPIHAFTKLIYERGHDIENDQLCLGRDPPKVLIGVISAPKNYAERNAIRSTWGNLSRNGDVLIAFFVGKSLDDKENRLIEKESLKYSDIVRSNNLDTYLNLTFKTISLIEWTYRHCFKARFVMKCDDDVFVNVTNLLSFINRNTNSKKTIFGELGKGLSPLWWPPKWYVSSLEYDKPKYPDFVFGPAYLLSLDCLLLIYEHSLNTEFFRLEDVFITGIVAESADIKRISSSLFVRRGYTSGIYNGMNFNLLKEAKIRISIHGVSTDETFEIWKFIVNNG